MLIPSFHDVVMTCFISDGHAACLDTKAASSKYGNSVPEGFEGLVTNGRHA